MFDNIIPNLQEDLHLENELFYEKYNDVFDEISEVRVYKVLHKLVERDKSFKVIYGYFYHPEGSFVFPGGQIDFIVYKEKKGLALIEVKGLNKNEYFQNKYDYAQKQLMRANDTLRKQINGLKCYTITMFPNYSLNDIQKTDSQYKYFVSKNEFELWESESEKVQSYFNEFFNEERFDGELNECTIEWINDIFSIDKYNKELEKERVAKEQTIINYKTKIFDFVKNSGYNCFLIKGYSGTGKTFIAMNMAMKSDRNTIFIVNTVALFNSIEKYFNKYLQKISEEYRNYKHPKNDIKKYVEYKLCADKKLKLLTLDHKNNQKEYQKIEALEKDISGFDLIILDEAQDAKRYVVETLFKECQMNNKCKPDKKLYLIGDDKQFISDAYHSEKDFNEVKSIIIEQKRNNKILYLDLNDDNCRNNMEIKSFVYKLRDQNKINDYTIKGIKVYFVDKKSQIDNAKLIECIKNYEEIIISNNKNDYRTNTIKKIREEVKKENEFSVKNYKLIKGCEYNSVVVLGLSKHNLLHETSDTDARRILYVCASRAKQKLALVFYIENNGFEEIQKEKEDIKDILVKTYLFDGEECFDN